MKIWSKLKDMKIYPKLVIFFLVSILPLYVVGWHTNAIGSKTMEKEIRDSATTKTHYYLESFTSDMTRIVQIINNYGEDEDIEKLSTMAPFMTQFERFQAINRIQGKLVALKNSSAYIKNARVYVPILERTIDYKGYYAETIASDEIDALASTYENGGPFVFLHDRLLFGLVFPGRMQSEQPPTFVFEVELDMAAIHDSLLRINSNSNTTIELVHQSQNWAISTKTGHFMNAMLNPDQLSSFGGSAGNTFLSVDGTRYLMTYEGDPVFGISIYMFIPEKEIFGAFQAYQKLIIVLAVLMVTLIFLITFGVHRFIHRPLVTLIQALRKVERGDFDVAVRSRRSQDEFSYVYLQFNSMVMKLKQLIQENYEQKISAQRSQLKQLQAQINPHFLYNSFFTLYQMVNEGDRAHSLSLIKHLRVYFQFITRNAQDEVPLYEEVNHALSFLQIQQMRFEDRIQVVVEDLPESIRHVMIPRLILQPLIENAFQHGLEEKTDNGLIQVKFKANDRSASLIVEDNGDSLQDEDLADLQQRLLSDDKYAETTGLINIHRRLQMFYSKEAGLRIDRGEWGGLRAEIIIPMEEG